MARLNSLSMLTKYTPPCGHYGEIVSKYSSVHSVVTISIIRFSIQATNTSTTTNYANVAYDLLTCKMASTTLTIESNSNDVMVMLCLYRH